MKRNGLTIVELITAITISCIVMLTVAILVVKRPKKLAKVIQQR